MKHSASIPQTLLEYSAVTLWMLIMLTIVHTVLSPRIAENDLRAALDHTVNLPVAAVNRLANLIIVLLIAPRFQRVLHDFVAVRPFAIYTVLVVISVLWSVNRDVTLRRGVYFLIDALAAAYFGGRYSVKDLSRLVAVSVVALMALSVLVYLIDPAMVMDVSHPGEWMGLSEHKNVFGQFIAFGLCFIALGDFGALNLVRIPTLFFALLMLWLSHSATSWLVGAFTLLAMPLLTLVRRSTSVWRPMACILAALSVLAFIIMGPFSAFLLQLLGKDPTLTGRTDLWSALIAAIFRRPLLGYGYAAFFSSAGELTTLQSHSSWVAPSAHNGYLEVGVDLGLVGLVVAFWFLIAFLADAIRYAQRVRDVSGLIPLSAVVFVVLHNCAEVSLLQTQVLTPFVMYFLFVSMRAHQDEVPFRVATDPSPKGTILRDTGLNPLHRALQ